MTPARGLVFLLATTTGCLRHPVGPRTIPAARFDYNEAISRSWDEQLLLNLVRLRYRDNPLFIEVNSITASYSLSRGVAADATVNGSDVTVHGGANLGFSENPVISYSYLHGEEFAQRLLSPLAPATLGALAQSGWSIQRLLLCCVQSINGVENAIAAAGPTPDYVPAFRRFQQVADLCRRLQVSGALASEQEPGGRTSFYLTSQAGVLGDSLRQLLSLDPRAESIEMIAARRPRTAAQVAVQGRSLLAVMYYLSHAIDVPPEHRAAGLVTMTRDSTGAEFDWSRVLGLLLRIRSSRSSPDHVAVRVHVRDHWFWIEDNDLNSKTTFALLRLLLFLKTGASEAASPLITIPSR